MSDIPPNTIQRFYTSDIPGSGPEGLKSGTYILIFELARSRKIRIGKLGIYPFPTGFFAYVGSAFGPGGLSARLRHHFKIAHKPHWHVDYFRKYADIKEVWGVEDTIRHEHIWASLLMLMENATILIPGFGSSDCKCESHLVYFKNKPEIQVFRDLNVCNGFFGS